MTTRTMTAKTDEVREAEKAALLRESRAIQDRLRQTDRHSRSLRERRKEIWKALLEDYEVDRAEVARSAGVTSMAVAFSVYGRQDRDKGKGEAEAV